MAETARLNLPLIDGAQALKHVTHNEALTRLDAAVQLTVEAFDLTAPPAAPEPGQIWGVGSGASDDWSGMDGACALFSESGWRFLTPGEGWCAWNRADGAPYVYLSGSWVPVVAAVPFDNLPRLGVNTTADATNRLAVKSNALLFSALEAEGGGSGDLRVALNKDGAGNTVSLVFQSGYSGRAEFGLAGGEDFAIKTSPDGSAFRTALTVTAADGFVRAGSLFGADISFPAVAGGVLNVMTSCVVPAPEAGSADDIDTIAGGFDGALLIVTGTDGNTLTVRNGTGNLRLGGDRVLGSVADSLMLVRREGDWVEVSYASNG